MQIIAIDFSKIKNRSIPLLFSKVAENIYCSDLPASVILQWFNKTKSTATKNTSILVLIPKKNEVSGWKYYTIGNKKRINNNSKNIYCIYKKIKL